MTSLSRFLDDIDIDPEATARLRAMRVGQACRELAYLRAMAAHNRPPYHGVNRAETATRRANNKRASATRRAQRRAA